MVDNKRGASQVHADREARGVRDPSSTRGRRAAPGLVTSLALALLLPAVVAWWLWTPTGERTGASDAAPSTLIDGADLGEGVIAPAPRAFERVARLPRPPRSQPQPLATAGPASPWGERFASTVAAFAGLASGSVRVELPAPPRQPSRTELTEAEIIAERLTDG